MFHKGFARQGGGPVLSVGMQYDRESLLIFSFFREDTEELMEKLKVSAAPGPDEIYPMVLKECAFALLLPLWIIFKRHLETGQILHDWKWANITPVYKRKAHSEQMMQRLIRDHMMGHPETSSKHQYEFRLKGKVLPYTAV